MTRARLKLHRQNFFCSWFNTLIDIFSVLNYFIEMTKKTKRFKTTRKCFIWMTFQFSARSFSNESGQENHRTLLLIFVMERELFHFYLNFCKSKSLDSTVTNRIYLKKFSRGNTKFIIDIQISICLNMVIISVLIIFFFKKCGWRNKKLHTVN